MSSGAGNQVNVPLISSVRLITVSHKLMCRCQLGLALHSFSRSKGSGVSVEKYRLFTGQQTTNDCYLRFCFATHLQPKASSLCTINNSCNLVPTFSNCFVFNLGLYSTLELCSGIFVLFFSVGFFPLFMLYCELNEWNNIAACFLSVMLVLKERVNSSTVDCCGAVRAVHLSVSASEVVISNVILTWK
ncbi:hypothetical protein DPX16_21058 [Anabarilius grahami]|uniref:Uncharacterized protein n=1 Tax=Anabarilius grahami TaxID=495550 RepID=A0A3N0YWU6_ANAGA|nr:hypothetical protein DPX16_21058 [Anabarilius grahami]